MLQFGGSGGIVDDEVGENATNSVNKLHSDQTHSEVGNLWEAQNEKRHTFCKRIAPKKEENPNQILWLLKIGRYKAF